ncbi:MAG: hypothetical protein FWG25_03755 [Promicromonosporaceae bacterium]|nr:hypothetical protein [Promicromonosporaceae bacterium]
MENQIWRNPRLIQTTLSSTTTIAASHVFKDRWPWLSGFLTGASITIFALRLANAIEESRKEVR